MRQMTGDILSLGSELFVHEATASQRIQLTLFSSNRLDLKLISINQNDSGIYTCMVNDDKLTSFVLEIFGKRSRCEQSTSSRRLSTVRVEEKRRPDCVVTA